MVGEDLGTVENGVRAELHRRGLLSYRLAWFEAKPPERYPAQALAALTTHDLPTAAGVWTGADLAEMESTGRPVNRDCRAAACAADSSAWPGSATTPRPAQVIERAYAALGRAPSRLVVATLDDACQAERRPNMPGDVARANWSIPLPRTLEQLRRDELPKRIAAALNARR